MGSELADELVAMAEGQFAAQAPLAELLEDDSAFGEWAAAAQPTLLAAEWAVGPPPVALLQLWEMHDRHDRRLIEIIDDCGWPGRSLVGEDGADAAWVIAQHADRHHLQRRSWLHLVEIAVDNSEADPRHLARLSDRVALLDQRRQLFGTYAWLRDDGVVEFDPLAEGSIADVDARRTTVGLPPLLEDLGEPPDAAPYRYMRTTQAFQWPAPNSR